jgi:succinoglycan biosynthesis protein ExoA
MASFCRAGGYDETFSHNEDAELDCRQRALGSRIYLDSGIRIGYLPRDSFKGLWRQYANYGAGRSRTIRKHPDSWRLRQLVVPANFLAQALAILLGGIWPVCWVLPLVYLFALSATALGLLARHRQPEALLALPVALVLHNAWAWGFLKGLLAGREERWTPDMAQPLSACGTT